MVNVSRSLSQPVLRCLMDCFTVIAGQTLNLGSDITGRPLFIVLFRA
jgi:hypothetical protein